MRPGRGSGKDFKMEEKTVLLHPVCALHGYAMNLPTAAGKRTYRFRVHAGDIEIHHLSFDGDIGLWSLPPQPGQWEKKVLHSGEEAVFTIDSRIHDFEPDCVEISNCHFGKPAEFSYTLLPEEQAS